MNLKKKRSLLMDLRLLVHQNQMYLLIPMTFLIMLVSSATSISATNTITNKINTELHYSRSNMLVEFNQNNSIDNNSYIYKTKSRPRILNSIIGMNISNKNEPDQQINIQQNQKFSQPLNKNYTDIDIGFRPIKPEGLDQNYFQNVLFTPDGHFRVFEDATTPSPTSNIAIHKKFQHQQSQQPVKQQLLEQQHQQQQYNEQPFVPILGPTFKLELQNVTFNVQNTTRPTTMNEISKQNLVKRHINSKSEKNLNTLVFKKNNTSSEFGIFKKGIELPAEPTRSDEGLFKNYSNNTDFNPFQEFMNSKLIQNLQKSLLSFIHSALSQNSYELFSGVSIRTKNDTEVERSWPDLETEKSRSLTGIDSRKSFGEVIKYELINFINRRYVSVNLPRAAETGRLFFFKGIKKLLWPLFLGVQIAKSILLALFLPSILGSLGKIVGKGLVQVSGFNHPSEAVHDLDFKDNSFNMMNDDDKYVDDYSYPRPEASENHFTAHLYEKATTNMNNALSRFGYGDNKKQHTMTHNTLFKDTNSKNSHSSSGNLGITNSKNSYKDFLKVPSSSLLLSNYDPFYSPLLSRIDSVFAQLGIAKKQDSCKEKLVCLMYAHPAKYAPYSNLVSAQLSRELNELRKPTSNNEEILRFFKYMKAAKEGQDGVDCEKIYESCKEYQDSDDPVMITTYNDINKLVQARKLLR